MPARPAQIGLIGHGGSISSNLIEWVTRSPVHHVVVALDDGTCIGAEPGGARIRPLSDFPQTSWSAFALTLHQVIMIVNWCRDHEGVPYNFLDDVAIGLALLTRMHVPGFVQRRLSSDEHLQCAQLADSAYAAAGVHLFEDVLPGAVYPGTFVPLWRQVGWM
jgi:hypothetical protein